MSKNSIYKIPIKDLDARISNNKEFDLIKDASREFHRLMKNNIRGFSKSNNLLTSWKFEIYNPKHSSIYSTLPYARIQDKGGKIKITKKMRKFGFYMYRKTRNKMWLRIAITKKKYIELPSKNYSKKVSLNKVKNYVKKRNPK